jgi:hypothetical protein
MSHTPPKNPPPLSGPALRAAVLAAETPLLQDIVKRAFFAQLDIDLLDALDLREAHPLPWILPTLATPEGSP